jgi:hypothetical protein
MVAAVPVLAPLRLLPVMHTAAPGAVAAAIGASGLPTAPSVLLLVLLQ